MTVTYELACFLEDSICSKRLPFFSYSEAEEAKKEWDNKELGFYARIYKITRELILPKDEA